MKIQKQEWEYVPYLDGKEIEGYRSTIPLSHEQIKEIIAKYNALFRDDDSDKFALEHKPEIVYRFRTRLPDAKTKR